VLNWTGSWRFAGLYSVTLTPPDDKDLLDVADHLIASGAAVFAEPEMVEVMGHR
jgi:hypothetical protein